MVVVHPSRLSDFWRYLGSCGRQVPSWGAFTLAVNRGRDCIVDQSNTGRLAASGEIFAGMDDDFDGAGRVGHDHPQTRYRTRPRQSQYSFSIRNGQTF